VTTFPIPEWNAAGLLPPADSREPTSLARSPYRVALTDLVLRFAHTPERRAVLDGYFAYRAALHEAGFIQGFQWLNGSFLEHIELLEQRPPNDLDVVSFIRYPSGLSQREFLARFPHLVPTNPHAQQALKATYRVDGYLVDLGMAAEPLVGRAAYWYSLWSHRRDDTWKGFLSVDLAPAQDAAARSELATLNSQRPQS
jgi:hypothetical protein